jgi:hypothetical protein
MPSILDQRDGEDRRNGSDGQELTPNGNGRFKVTTDKVITVVVTVLLTYAAMNARIAVVESRVNTLQDDISEIKNDVKQLLRDNR